MNRIQGVPPIASNPSRMQTLVVVRHGQASAHARDYDVLSPLGEKQARLLGEHLANRGVVLDAVVAGPRKRQRDTASLLVEAAVASGARWPAPVFDDDLDEIPLREILITCLPRWIETDPVARSLHEHEHGVHTPDEIRDVLVRAMRTWALGDLEHPDVATFDTFRARVLRAIDASRNRGANVLIATSAGPVAVALQLGGHPRTATPTEVMDLAMTIVNASVSQLAYDATRGQPRLTAANDASHFAPSDVTYF
jgi:broad specificity phosphatase PhoE